MAVKTGPKGLGGWVAFESMLGNEAKAADLAVEVGCSWVAPRAGDGTLNDGGFKLADIAVYKSKGLQVFPWLYSRPSTWRSEIDAFRRIMDAGADGVIIDAEIQWEGHALDAGWYAEGLRKALPDAWIADAPWPWILYHPTFPEREFSDLVDARLIQAYWCEINRSGAKAVTLEAERQWAARFATPGRTPAQRDPVYPVACTYGRAELQANGAPPCPGDMTAADLSWFLDHYPEGTPVSLYSLEMLLANTPVAREVRGMLRERVQRKPTLPSPPLTIDYPRAESVTAPLQLATIDPSWNVRKGGG